MTTKEKRISRLLRLPSVENFVRNNRRRFDETVAAIRNFDLNPPRHSLGPVRTICRDIANGDLSQDEISARIEAIGRPIVRSAARDVVPVFQRYLATEPVTGFNHYNGFSLPYPIGPNPRGGTLSIPLSPTFVGAKDGRLTAFFLIPWAKFFSEEFSKTLMSSIIADGLLTYQDFVGGDAEILGFPRILHDKQRYPVSWSVRDYATLDRERLDEQFGVFNRALKEVVDELEAADAD